MEGRGEEGEVKARLGYESSLWLVAPVQRWSLMISSK